MNKGQLVTRYIKHLADSASFKGGTINKHRNGLIGNHFEMPNVSYTHPLPTRRTEHSKRVENFPMQSHTQICNTFALCKQNKK